MVQDGNDRAMHIVNVQNLRFPCRALTPDRDVESVFTMNQSRNETVPGKRRQSSANVLVLIPNQLFKGALGSFWRLNSNTEF